MVYRPGRRHRRAHGARGAGHPAEAVGAGGDFAGPGPWPGEMLTQAAGTMNALTPPDLRAADLRALARLDDDRASPAVTPPQVSDRQAVAAPDAATAIASRGSGTLLSPANP